jgi:rRNA-processing protein FCF1
LEGKSDKQFRVILKREEPSTDIKNVKGILSFQKNKFIFLPRDYNKNLERTYTLSHLKSARKVTVRELFKKKEIILLQLSHKQASVDVYLEPIDVSSDFLLQEILLYQETTDKESFSGIVGSLVEKIGTESQKIVREVGAIIESSSRELSQALGQTTQFIREATQAANLLDNMDITIDENSKVIDLNVSDIDEILKRSLASEKIEAMITGLIAKGLISANNHKFQEARDALKIAREAAKNENMKEYTEIVDENIRHIDTVESTETIDPQLGEKAMKYANEARNIVAEWESSKKNQNEEDQN